MHSEQLTLFRELFPSRTHNQSHDNMKQTKKKGHSTATKWICMWMQHDQQGKIVDFMGTSHHPRHNHLCQ